MNKYTLLIIAIIISINSGAQHTRTFHFKTARCIHSSNYDRLKVIDLRKDSGIGYVNTGGFNRKATLITEKPFGDLVADFYNKLLDSNKSDGELVLALHDFKIEEPIFGEIGTVYFDGDFYSCNKDNYTYLGSTDSFFEVRSHIDVTSVVIAAATTVISRSLAHYSHWAYSTATTETFNLEQVMRKRINDKVKYPIYRSDSFKLGIYRTINDFINNTPEEALVAEEYVKNGKEKYYSFYYETNNGKKGARVNEDSYFAIFDGTEWVLSSYKYGTKMHYKNGDFYAVKEMSGLADVTNAVTGLAGGLILGVAKSGRHINYRCKFDPAKKEFRPIQRLN